MIEKMPFLDAENVILRIKQNLPPGIESLLALGAGALDFERQIFDFNHLFKVAAVEWADENLKQLAEIPKVVPLKIDLAKMAGVFPPASFDVVTMFDIVEHLDVYAAYKTIREAVNISRKIVICFVPVQGHLHGDINELEKLQKKYQEEGDVLRAHLSLWVPEHFNSLGFEVLYDSTYHQRNGTIGGIEGAMICWKEKK